MSVDAQASKPGDLSIREVQGKYAQILAAAIVGGYAFWVGAYVVEILECPQHGLGW